MHFNRKELTAAVTALTKLIGARQVRPVLACVELSTSHVYGTDLDTWLSFNLNGVATGTYAPVCVPAKQLLAVLKASKDDLVLVAGIGDTVTVDGMWIESFDTQDMPRPYDFPVEVMQSINSARLNTCIDVAFCAASYYDSNVLSAMAFKSNECCVTDGSRISWIPDTGFTLDALAPASVMVKHVQPLLKRQAVVSVAVADKRLHIGGSNWEICTRLIDGEYPRYAELFPALEPNLAFDKRDMLTALDKIKPFVDKRLNTFAFESDETGVVSIGDNRAMVSVIGKGSWTCSYGYFRQAVESMPDGRVRLAYQAPKLLVFHAPGYKHLLAVQVKAAKPIQA